MKNNLVIIRHELVLLQGVVVVQLAREPHGEAARSVKLTGFTSLRLGPCHQNPQLRITFYPFLYINKNDKLT